MKQKKMYNSLSVIQSLPIPIPDDPFHYQVLLMSDYNFAPLPPRSSAPAPAIHSLPVSLTFVWKITLLPCFHISVTSVCPGRTVPANLTLTFLIMPKVCTICFPLKPKKHNPCKIGTLNPPTLLNSGSICNGLRSPFSLYSAA